MQTLGQQIVGVFYEVYRELGHGFLESAYQRAMHIALSERGIHCEREVPVSVQFRGRIVGEYRMDLVANRAFVIECKTADKISPAHHAQLLNYLKATDYNLGLILNFGPKPSFKRLIYESARARDHSIVEKESAPP